MFTFSDR